MRHGLQLPARTPDQRRDQRLANIEKKPIQRQILETPSLQKRVNGTSDWDTGSGAWVDIPEMIIVSVGTPVGCGVRLDCIFGYNYTIALGANTFRFQRRTTAGPGAWGNTSYGQQFNHTPSTPAGVSNTFSFWEVDEPGPGLWDYKAQLFQNAGGLLHGHAATNGNEKRHLLTRGIHLG